MARGQLCGQGSLDCETAPGVVAPCVVSRTHPEPSSCSSRLINPQPPQRPHNCRACTQDFPLFFTAGVHPHNAKECTDSTLDELRQLAAHERCVAIGAGGRGGGGFGSV